MTDSDVGAGDLIRALGMLPVAAYVVDARGRIRWQNRGSIELIGERLGEHFARAVAPEDVHLVRTQLARKLIGEALSTEYTLTLMDRGGRRLRVRASSVPLRQERKIVGVFGVAYPANLEAAEEERDAAEQELTARQYEVLFLLADGLGTSAIAKRLGIAEETARNHIRAILRQLGVHSRLEAVVRAYALGLLQRRREE
jgi:DNA-binding CsgD family transcriptional regulator